MRKLFLLLPFVALLAAFTTNTPPPGADPTIPADVQALLDKNGCAACHNISRKLVGPAWVDVAAKKYSKKQILALVAKPQPSNWPGYPPMAAQTTVPKKELDKIATWLVGLK